MKVKYNIPFVVTSGGRLLTCSDLDSLQDGHNSMEQEFQQLKDSAFSGQNVEIRRGVIPIELDLEQLFTPIVVSPQTTGEDNPPNSAPKLTAESPPKSSASTCTEKQEKVGEIEVSSNSEEESSTFDVLQLLRKQQRATQRARANSSESEMEKVANDCRNAIMFSAKAKDLVENFTHENQALLVADLSNATFDGEFGDVIIPIKDLHYLDSL